MMKQSERVCAGRVRKAFRIDFRRVGCTTSLPERAGEPTGRPTDTATGIDRDLSDSQDVTRRMDGPDPPP
ncbi:MAG: hypothetical protein ABSC19_14445 [Syntrophorhabdales bacterium]|jgi:hypothetical protein